MREQRVSGVPGPFSSLQSLPSAFMMRSKPSAYYLIAAANSSSSSSAGKCQLDRLSVRKRDERRESNESPSLFHTTCGQPKPHSEAHRDTIGAWQPDRTACHAWTGHGWGRQWWPAIRTSNGHLGAPLRCTLSSSCHRIVLATAPGVPTPQHRFPDPQKLAAGFQLAFSRTGPKTVSCSPLPVPFWR